MCVFSNHRVFETIMLSRPSLLASLVAVLAATVSDRWAFKHQGLFQLVRLLAGGLLHSPLSSLMWYVASPGLGLRAVGSMLPAR